VLRQVGMSQAGSWFILSPLTIILRDKFITRRCGKKSLTEIEKEERKEDLEDALACDPKFQDPGDPEAGREMSMHNLDQQQQPQLQPAQTAPTDSLLPPAPSSALFTPSGTTRTIIPPKQVSPMQGPAQPANPTALEDADHQTALALQQQEQQRASQEAAAHRGTDSPSLHSEVVHAGSAHGGSDDGMGIGRHLMVHAPSMSLTSPIHTLALNSPTSQYMAPFGPTSTSASIESAPTSAETSVTGPHNAEADISVLSVYSEPALSPGPAPPMQAQTASAATAAAASSSSTSASGAGVPRAWMEGVPQTGNGSDSDHSRGSPPSTSQTRAALKQSTPSQTRSLPDAKRPPVPPLMGAMNEGNGLPMSVASVSDRHSRTTLPGSRTHSTSQSRNEDSPPSATDALQPQGTLALASQQQPQPQQQQPKSLGGTQAVTASASSDANRAPLVSTTPPQAAQQAPSV
jgi:hypothetical protein